ncbi:hypothetical protein PCANC_17112 [Puccinia coronata f. sp. avenae]|uniref:Uncharacterized protein n=1 Tax=Puccinia coronata f. sp. avenae TaxID=200324 RepID=A0A2N5THE9_9BASI|nr:hypothetical protein PCASD_23678 [Puccinia coronata f. sp. avenae]PLW27357.1 hypothetical protein PCASD_20944 [Puccinia coronata f. sp. avenae]PLW32904.1 hypothetical protein PCANC_17112 [Puccinia coronata f. sp. avenae]
MKLYGNGMDHLASSLIELACARGVSRHWSGRPYQNARGIESLVGMNSWSPPTSLPNWSGQNKPLLPANHRSSDSSVERPSHLRVLNSQTLAYLVSGPRALEMGTQARLLRNYDRTGALKSLETELGAYGDEYRVCVPIEASLPSYESLAVIPHDPTRNEADCYLGVRESAFISD